MDPRTLLERLIAAGDEAERRGLLATHRQRLDAAFFRMLKGRVLERARQDSQEALQTAQIGLEAAEFAVEQEGVAYAWWAEGVAWHFLGQYEDCLAAYSTAISLLAGLNRPELVAQLQTNCIPPLMHIGRLAEAQAMGASALQTLQGQGDTRALANLLLNLGMCARLQRNYSAALAQIRQAADVFSRLGDTLQTARCRVTQAVALENLDRFDEADSLLRRALQVFVEHEAWLPWARAALNLGILHTRLAHHQVALYWLEESRHAFLKAGNPTEAAVADLYRAHSLLDVHLWPEVAMLSEELIKTFARLKMPRQAARASLLLAQVYMHHGEKGPALRELARARRSFRAQQDPLEVAWLDLQRAALLREVGRPEEATRLATTAAEVLDVHRYPLRHAEAHLVIAACCEDMGMIEEAQVAYRVAWAAGCHPTDANEPPPALACRIAHARGTIAEAAGRLALARGEYGRAVGYLTRIARGLGLDELRGGYLADKRPLYEAALRLALEDRRTADAFQYSELARAGALRDFVAGRPEAAPGQVGSTDALDDLKARWTWRISVLRQPLDLAEEIEPQDRMTLLRELADLERELADAYRRRRLTDPRFAALEQGQLLGLEQVRRHLSADVGLLSFDRLGDRLLAFVITPETVDIVQLGSLTGLRRAGERLGHALQEAQLFDAPADLALLEAELLQELQALYRAVLAVPLARLGPDVRRLLIVPCDVLHTLPLGAFYDGRQYLVERYALCYLPAASLLPQGREVGIGSLTVARDGLSLVLAHSWDGRLPLVLEEAAEVAQTLARACGTEPLLLSESHATTRALRQHAGKVNLLHAAAHGAFRDDAPLFSSLHLADGLLTVNEIYGLDLSQAALVTLSACETGLGQGRGGEMLGLAHALFFAGAPTLVASRWRVDDAATAELMVDFYRALARGEGVAPALRMAQLNMLARRPHAYYWAGFAAWGRGFDVVFDSD